VRFRDRRTAGTRQLQVPQKSPAERRKDPCFMGEGRGVEMKGGLRGDARAAVAGAAITHADEPLYAQPQRLQTNCCTRGQWREEGGGSRGDARAPVAGAATRAATGARKLSKGSG